MAAAWSRTSGGTSTGGVTAVGRAIGAMTTPRSIWRGIARPGHPTKLAWWGPARRLGWSLREAQSRGQGPHEAGSFPPPNGPSGHASCARPLATLLSRPGLAHIGGHDGAVPAPIDSTRSASHPEVNDVLSLAERRHVETPSWYVCHKVGASAL